MVNKTQFYKTKVALAVVLSLGLAACGDSDGDTSNANSTADTVTEAVDNTIEQVSGTGSVQGTVLDTNGLPVMDATVSLSGQTVMTDASGYYHFTDVPLPGVDGVNGEATDADAASGYNITITGPEGYASAIVNVNPEDIQVDSDNNGTNANGSDTTANGDQTTWFDGFLAQADTAELPKFAAAVTGVLRNCATGAPLAEGTVVALDFATISTTTTNPGTNTDVLTGVTVGVPTFTTTVGADGVFSFDALPTDSTLNLAVEGYTSVANIGTATELVVAAVPTVDEGIVNNLGDISACAITSSDTVAPYIINATGYIENDAAFGGEQYGMLNRGIDQTFTLWFNEPVNAEVFNASDVLVTLANAEYLSVDTATLATDGKSVTVVLTEALADGDKISIFIPWADATDVAGNFFSVSANDALTPTILWDYKTSASSGKAVYLKSNLCTFIEPTTGGVGTTTQVVDEVAGEDGDSASLAAYSNAYIDSREDTSDSVVQQVNGSDSAERLSVFRAIQGNATTTQNITAVAGTTVTLTSAPVGVLSYTVGGTPTAITSVSGAVLTVPALAGGEALVVNYIASTYEDRQSRATIAFDGSATATASGVGSTSITSAAAVASSALASTHYFDVDGVDHNDTIKVVYTDDLGVITKTESVTFTDQAKPTTVIQDDYDLHAYNNTGSYTATVTSSGQAQYGNGGETSHALISDVPGNPTIYIQPRHLAQKGTNGAAPVRGTEFNELVAGMNDRLGTGESPATPVANESSLSVFDANSTTFTAAALYDATAIETWTVGQDIGVAFSEVIALSTGAPTFTGTSVLSGFAAENAVTSDVDANANILLGNAATTANAVIKPNLVIFNTTDVVGLANNDNGAILGFATAVADARGNVADVDSNAQVVLLDAMPPMVETALWTGTELEITFNEAISIHATTARDLNVYSPVDASIAPANVPVTLSNGTLSNNDMTLSIVLSSAQASAVSVLFQNGNDGEFLYDDDATSTDEENHAVLAWDEIDDANGNDWNDINVASTRFQTTAPRFLMVNGVGTFTYSVATSGYLDTGGAGDDDGAVTYVITFTHPINITSPYDNATLPSTPTATALGTAIQTAEGVTWSGIGTAGAVASTLSWTSANATDLPVLNAIFRMDDIGSTEANDGDSTLDTAVFAAVPTATGVAAGSVIISSDFRTITLNVDADNNGVTFGTSDFIFQTVVDSNLITGNQTTAGRFNWQNNN